MLAGRHKALALIGGEFVAADRRPITFVISLRLGPLNRYPMKINFGVPDPAQVDVTGGIG